MGDLVSRLSSYDLYASCLLITTMFELPAERVSMADERRSEGVIWVTGMSAMEAVEPRVEVFLP